MMDKLNGSLMVDLLEKYNTICDKVSADIKKLIANPKNQNKISW